MKKLLLATIVTITTVVAFAAPSEASHRWRHGHWNGHHRAFGFVVDVGPGYYDDGGDCYIKKVRRYDRYGNLYVKKVTVCE